MSDDLGVSGRGDGVDCFGGALVLAVGGCVLDQRRLEQEQRLDIRERVHFLDEEVGDSIEERGVVTVVLVCREVRKRVRPGEYGLKAVVDVLGGRAEVCGNVAAVSTQVALTSGSR